MSSHDEPIQDTPGLTVREEGPSGETTPIMRLTPATSMVSDGAGVLESQEAGAAMGMDLVNQGGLECAPVPGEGCLGLQDALQARRWSSSCVDHPGSHNRLHRSRGYSASAASR